MMVWFGWEAGGGVGTYAGVLGEPFNMKSIDASSSVASIHTEGSGCVGVSP